MSHSDKSKGTSVRKGARKAENRELPSRVAEATEAPVPAPAPAPEPKKDEATDLHAEFQKLTQHAADLETQNGDLDEQLKRAREQVSELGRQLEASRESQKKAEAERDQAKAKADEQERGATGMAEAVAALRKRIDESRAELKKLQGTRDQVEKRAVQAEARAAELDRKVQELSAAAGKTPGLEKDLEASSREAAKLRAELEALKAEGAELRRKADAAGAEGSGLRRQLDASKEETAQARREAEDLKKKLQDAEAKVAESGRYFGSLEKELLEARESEAKAQKEASQLPDLRSVVSQLENSRREEQRRYKELLQKSTDLERKLTESLFAKPEPPPAPAPIVVAESKPSPVDSIFDPEPPPAEPPRIAATIPPPQAVPGPSSSPETTLRPQHAFGPTAEDGRPAYVLHEMLPPDPMGVLYRASERASGRQFAVRFMAGQAGEEQTQAIEREVEKLIALPHPNILHVQGSGRRKNRLYLAMDLVLAPTLGRAKIHEIPRICEILRDAAGAVHYAHEEKIFHGDLHLDTILVAKGENGADHALVKDFELAYLMETLLGPASGRDARSPLRNLAYQAPEHVNEAKPTLRASLDVYGLGATLYAALAGKPPFEAKDPAQLRKKVMFEDPVPVEKIRADVPEALAAIVRKAMVKESGLRYATAQAVSDALAKFLDSTHS